MISEAIFFVIGVVIGGFSLWFLKQKEIGAMQNNNENMQKAFSNLSNEAVIENQKKWLEVAEDKCSDLIESSGNDLDKKKDLIDVTLKDMKSGLKNLSENTRALKSQMEASRKSVGDLSDTTSKLRQILSSSQARGQWGERMVEDILNFIGLSEGINFTQRK